MCLVCQTSDLINPEASQKLLRCVRLRSYLLCPFHFCRSSVPQIVSPDRQAVLGQKRVYRPVISTSSTLHIRGILSKQQANIENMYKKGWIPILRGGRRNDSYFGLDIINPLLSYLLEYSSSPFYQYDTFICTSLHCCSYQHALRLFKLSSISKTWSWRKRRRPDLAIRRFLGRRSLAS